MYVTGGASSLWGGDGSDTMVVLGGTSQVVADGTGPDMVVVNPGSHVTVYATNWTTLTLKIGNQTVKGEYYSTTDEDFIANIGAGYTAQCTEDGILIEGPNTTILLRGPYNITVKSHYDEETEENIPDVGPGTISTPQAVAIPAALQTDINEIIAYADSFPETVSGGGSGGGDTHTGTTGDDNFDASADAGNTTYDGGDGLDWISYLTTSLGVSVNLATGQASGSEIGTDTLLHIENARGGTGNDTVTGNDAVNQIAGKSGNDSILGAAGNDTIWADDGNDYANGGADNDTLYGWLGNDTLLGEGGNDFIGGDDGADVLNGGDGTDTLFGWHGNDSLVGGAGADTLSGENNSDTIEGGAGGDSIVGGAGVDLLSYLTSTAGVSVNLKVGGFIAGGDAAGDTVSGMEDVTGSGFADTLTGDAIGNKLYGNAGNDTINGGEDNAATTMEGADTGNDSLYGGDGNDVLDGKDGNDWVYGDADNDIVRGGTGNDTVYGGTGADSINGQSGDDHLYGMAGGDGSNNTGNDTIFGGDGADVVTGSGGQDSVNGEGGNDYVDGKDGEDTVYGGAGLDSVYGGVGNDLIYAGADDDYVSGQGGDDIIYGQTGADVLSGGLGLDRFVFETTAESSPSSTDRITDFSRVDDLIDLSLISGINSFADLVVTLNGADTEITYSTTFKLLLTGDYTSGANTLDGSDFVF